MFHPARGCDFILTSGVSRLHSLAQASAVYRVSHVRESPQIWARMTLVPPMLLKSPQTCLVQTSSRAGHAGINEKNLIWTSTFQAHVHTVVDSTW